MFGQILYTQWKWARTELIAYSLGAFLMPTIILKLAMSAMNDFSIGALLGTVSISGAFFLFLAFVCAVGFAVRPYLMDQALKHVYALSLPVPWPTLVRYRFAAGAALLLIPSIAVYFGAALATATAQIPATLHSYPGGLAVRFYFSALEFYAATFLLQYVTGRNAVRTALGIIGLLVAVELGGRMLGYTDAFTWMWDHLTSWPGPFMTLSARWMMIDV